MRKPFIAGNWKMNMDKQSGVALAQAVAQAADAKGDAVTVAVCPPFVYLDAVSEAVKGSKLAVGSQDLYFEANGAFTGEISTDMLKDVGCTYVLCGHSERRHVLGEDDAMVNKKLVAALDAGLLPILCVGELIEERQAEKTEAVVETQIKEGLKGLDAAQMDKVTVAYEPVWAIGTGLTATPEQAQEVHAFIRNTLSSMFGAAVADATRIQYGGSVKPDNTAELMKQPDVDGCLVGGAALKPESFVGIIEAAG